MLSDFHLSHAQGAQFEDVRFVVLKTTWELR